MLFLYKAIASRTVSFVIDTTGTPTSPYFTIDFGDGTAIANSQLLSSRPTTIRYTYASSGSYSVAVKMFNQISSFTINKTVIVNC